MYFENVQLPLTVIADLYKHSLVLVDDIQHQPAIPETGVQPGPRQVAKPAQAEISPAPLRQEPITASAAAAPAFRYLGNFGKEIAIVVTEHFHPHIADADLEFLSKMLAACKLSMNDVAIINSVNNPQIEKLWDLMPSKVLLLFDVDHAAVGLSFRRPHFEIQQWSGAVFMSAPGLESFRSGNDAEVQSLKRKLWNGLQKIFPAS